MTKVLFVCERPNNGNGIYEREFNGTGFDIVDDVEDYARELMNRPLIGNWEGIRTTKVTAYRKADVNAGDYLFLLSIEEI